MIIGIDPGATGGIARLTDDGAVLEISIMPSIREFAAWINIYSMGSHVFIEKAQSMPKQGIASAFNYGRHFGELLGVLVSHNVRHTLVPPATWSRQIHAGTAAGKTKDRSIEAAARLFPAVELRETLANGRLSKNPHLGKTEALLIAEHCRRLMHGGINV